MAHLSFGTGWPNCSTSPVVTLVRRDGLRLPLHRDLIPLVGLLCDLTEAVGYDLVPGWCWGHACRAIRGINKPSNHSWGTAVDLNAPKNPMASAAWHRANASRGTRPFGLQVFTDMPEKMINIWEGNGFRWGGRYVSRPDPMHFEFMGSTADARRIYTSLHTFLKGAKAPVIPPKPKPAPVGALPTLRRGNKGRKVGDLQRMLINCAGQSLKVNNNFGSGTEQSVKAFQKFFGLPSTGVMDQRSWNALTFACQSK